MKVKYPKVKFDSKQRIYVTFYLNNKRFRLFNGKKINCEIYPNSFPIEKRLEMGNLLAAEVYKFITSGLSFNSLIIENQYYVDDIQYLRLALNNKLNEDYSLKYKSMLRFVYRSYLKETKSKNITSEGVISFLNQYVSGVSYNTIKRHLNVLINEAINLGMDSNPMEGIKSKKTKAKLHKPYLNIKEILEEIKLFNDNLYLCCLITYGCLLRPHREIRELTWGDFSDDLKHINLSGNRNKSGRNRIVPVPTYIREILVKGELNNNIFSNKIKPLNKDYFKTLWSRFKKQSDILEQGQTLYSFRHSGAIEIFKRTGSLTKLQKAMGHSSLNVSLTYLRGLEVAELKEEDMPMV
ncbi:tyrosine-type recombinase/integrase [Flavobacteriaceae bacterium]|nr:tyrosine-type recombinase/integrase [Flavobacteriaceae bacterium]